MVQRHKLTDYLMVAALAMCSCSGKVAATGSTGPFDTTNLGWDQRRDTASPSGMAQQMKEQATVLHRAGEYEEAAAEFARAAEVLEGSAGGLSSPPALSAIRLSLAAAQLKSGDVQGAESTCSQLLRTPGLARLLRQKAYYRRAMARRRQVDATGNGEAGSRLVLKAYRDAYLSVKLSQSGRGVGPAEGDAKAAGLLAEIGAGPWEEGWLTNDDRAAAQSKADKHLASLDRAAVPRNAAPGGGMFDMFGGAGGAGASSLVGLPGLGGGNDGMGGMPGLMDMMGAGAGAGGGTEGMGDIMNMLMGGAAGAAGAAGAGGATAGGGPDKKQMLKMAKKMSKVVKKQLRNPSTQQFVCSFLKQAEPATLKSMAGAAGMPLNDGVIDGVSKYLKEADGKTLESWVDYGEIASGVYRRGSQLAVLFSRGIALAGVWLVWVWLRACFAPIVLTAAKA